MEKALIEAWLEAGLTFILTLAAAAAAVAADAFAHGAPAAPKAARGCPPLAAHRLGAPCSPLDAPRGLVQSRLELVRDEELERLPYLGHELRLDVPDEGGHQGGHQWLSERDG
jgi:hypothetical protein